MTKRKRNGKFKAPLFDGRQRRPHGLVIKLHFPESLTAIKAAGGFATPERVEHVEDVEDVVPYDVPYWKAEARLPKGDGTFLCKNFEYTTAAEREQEARKIAAAWLRGERAEQAQQDAPWTADVAFENWLASLDGTRRTLTPSAKQAYRSEYEKDIAPMIGRKLLTALTDGDMRKLKDSWASWTNHRGEQQPRMQRTIQRFARRTRAFLRYAREQGQLKAIPGDEVLKIDVHSVSDGGDMREHYPLDDDTLRALLATIRQIATPSVAMACRLASVVGLRDQEVTHLTLDTLVLDADVPHVWIRSKLCGCAVCVRRKDGRWTPKTKRERKVPLPPELVTELRAYMADREVHLTGRESIYVFPMWVRGKRHKVGAQTERSTFNDAVRRATVALGIEVDKTRELLTFHTLRSVAATNLDARSNGNHTAVSVALGHKLASVTEHYNTLRKQLPKLYAALYPDAVDGPKLVQTGVKRIA